MIPRFRAYDPAFSKMYLPEEIKLVLLPDGRGFAQVRPDMSEGFQYRPKVIPLLSTGLEDSKHCEVFEGDVLHDLLHTEQYFVVEWQAGGFRLKLLIPKLSTGGDEDIDTVGEMEIVGDIYTNPEFIAEKE